MILIKIKEVNLGNVYINAEVITSFEYYPSLNKTYIHIDGSATYSVLGDATKELAKAIASSTEGRVVNLE